MEYTEQLLWKKTHVLDSFLRIGKITGFELMETMPAPLIFGYRNKMEFSFGGSRWLTDEEIAGDSELLSKDFGFGLHIPGRFDKILDIDECKIQTETGNDILKEFRSLLSRHNFKAYHQVFHTGFLKNLLVRYSLKENKYLIVLITTTPSNDEEEDFIVNTSRVLFEKFPEMSGFLHAINDTVTPVATGNINFIKGRDYLIEDILGIDFKISPFSFFQTNPSQLQNFIGEIINYADIQPNEIIWDLYCGTGSITLPAAKKCKKIFGFELVQSAIDDANNNAQMNKIDNSKFFCMDIHNKLNIEIIKEIEQPDTIIIDPPRAGIHQNLLDLILAVEPEKIVYVSCNPATQARDCALLNEKYNIIKLQPVDMFPHTYHVENIALLTKKDN